jgi:prolipoprotein diacylglyceryl transferase
MNWYGVCWGFAFITGFLAFKELVKFEQLPENFMWWALLYIMVGAVVGARLGHCFFYDPSYFLKNPLEIVTSTRGMASHGGVLGVMAALYLLSRQTKKPYSWILDRMAVVFGITACCIRIGNLMNSEIYGHATTLPWGFIFERKGETLPKHPTQLYEALYCVLTYIVLRYVYRKCNNRPRPFLMLGLSLIIICGCRFCVEFIKNPQKSFEADMLFNMGQLLSIPFLIVGVIALIISRRQKNRLLSPTDHA